MTSDRQDTARFPWVRLMGLGLGVLRLPSSAFWSMTPRELRAALEGAGLLSAGANALDRRTLAQLMMRYPDQQGN